MSVWFITPSSPPPLARLANDSASSRRDLHMENLIDSVFKQRECKAHNRPICPECEFGCKKCSQYQVQATHEAPEVNGNSTNHETEAIITSLEAEEGEQIFVTTDTTDAVPFSWSHRDIDDSRLESLTRATEFDELMSISCTFKWDPRFIPQWDEQVQGVKVWDEADKFRYIKFKAPTPLAPDKIRLNYCEHCQLTWLTGTLDEHAQCHPAHDTLSVAEASPRLLEQRSIIVYIDGEKGVEHNEQGSGIARLGMYFGKDSKYNHSQPMYLIGDSNTRRCAEIHAARHVLTIVKNEIIPDRKAACEDAEKSLINGKKEDAGESLVNGKKPSPKHGSRSKPKNKKNGRSKKANKESNDRHQSADGLFAAPPTPEYDRARVEATPANQVPKAYHVERPFDTVEPGQPPAQANQGSEEDSICTSHTPEANSLVSRNYNNNDFRLIIATHSKELIDLFCNHIAQWKYDTERKEYRRRDRKTKKGTKKGEAVRSSDIIADVQNELDRMAAGVSNDVRVAVNWYHIPGKMNQEARKLADPTSEM
ncbi:Uu.00g107860.m01.CDS01 [Anthostomella pinea]|uniref:Uu.00g107860.m01.CDS01 n=1 Tax=Anthostomella pinea TaxID=933095 RepID=A0AAI8VED2_9PEZI|nr:Uu.00g107860.m01.CDS01 [Anthostomella pinea]